MYAPLQVNRFRKSVLLIVQYKYLKSCSGNFYSPELILRTRSCGTGFITQSRWCFHFRLTTLVMWKCFVPQLYQFPRGISGGPALEYFYMTQRGGRLCRHLTLKTSTSRVMVLRAPTIKISRASDSSNDLRRVSMRVFGGGPVISWTRRAHFNLSPADTTVVTAET